jgi:large repetitive protein
MRSLSGKIILLIVYFCAITSLAFAQKAPPLGAARMYHALADKKVVNKKSKTENAVLGVTNGSVSGFSRRALLQSPDVKNAAARKAMEDARTAYSFAFDQKAVTANANKKAFNPGTYKFGDGAIISGPISLDGAGNYIFQVPGDLTISSNSSINYPKNIDAENIFWVVEGNLKVGKGANISGTFISKGKIELEEGAKLRGRLISLDNQVTMTQAVVNIRSDLSVTTDISPSSSGTGSYLYNEEVTITITVKNNGTADEDGAIVKSISYSGDLVSSSSTAYNPQKGEWVVGSLDNGQTATLTLLVKFSNAGLGVVRASAEGNNIDEDLSNNTASTTYCVLLPSTGDISGAEQVCAGQSYEYSIEPVNGATRYTWSVPTGWTFVRVSPTKIRVTPGTTSGQISVQTSNICGESPAKTLDVASTSATPAQPDPITGPTTVCTSAVGVKFSVNTLAGADSYNWSVPAGWTITDGQGTREITVTAGTAGGTVSVQGANICGSGVIRAFNVGVIDAVPIVSNIRGAQDACVGTSTTFEIDPVDNVTAYTWTVPTGWTITSGANTNKITVTVGNTAGNISVVVDNACGASEPKTLAVNPTNGAPTQPGTITGSATVCVSQQNVTYFIGAVSGASGYNWTVPAGWTIVSGQGTAGITVNAGTAGGNITVTADNVCGSSAARSLAVSVTAEAPAQPGAVTGTATVCEGSSQNYFIGAVSGASSYVWTVPADWSIVAGQGTTSITVIAGKDSGSVSVAAVNACGEGASSALAVTSQDAVPAAPDSISGSAEVCQNASGLTYSVTPVAGISSYTWTVPTGWTITNGQGTASITVSAGTAGGDISVTATNACGTGAARSLAVNVAASAPSQPTAITGSGSVCSGQAGLTYFIDAVSGASGYTWAVPAGWTITSGQGTVSITATAGTAGGNVSVTANNACGISAAREMAVTMKTPAPSTPVAITGATNPCVGSEYTYSIDPVSGATNYIWTLPTGWSIAENNGTSIKVVAGSNAGNVSVSASNECGASAPQTFAVNPTSEAPTGLTSVNGNAIACAGATLTYSVEPSANASSYLWTVPAGWTITSGQGTTSITVTAGSASGPVSLTANNECGSTNVGRVVTITTNAPNTPDPISGPNPVCEGATATFSVEAVAGATTYNWAFPAGWTIVSGQGTRSVEVTVGSAAGTARVNASNVCGNSANSELAVAPQPKTLVITSDITASKSAFCQNETNLTYSITPVVGATKYDWSVPTGWTIVSGQGTTAIVANAGTANGNVTITASNTCGTTVSKSIAVQPSKTPTQLTAVSGPDKPCVGTEATYTVSAEAGVTYTWIVPASWTVVSGQGTNTLKVRPSSTTGSVSVDARNICGTTTPVSLQVQPTNGVPTAPGMIRGAATVCAGKTITYNVDPSAGATSYEWTLPAGWSIASGQGTTQIQVLTGSNSGTISVVAKNSCGSSMSASMNINSKAIVAPTEILDRSEPCKGLVYEVAPVSGAVSYVWTVPAGWSITSGAGTSKITVTAGAGTGVITVAVDNGACISESVSITPNKELANTAIEIPNVFSPNNDGINDTWVIKNLENFTDNDLVVFNRWGNEVFKAKSYNSGWNGNGLSEGTYFYTLRVKLCDGSDKVFKGYVMIVR